MSNSWKRLKTGNVVRWCDELYIVADSVGPNGTSVKLIPFNYSGSTSRPSLDWPFKYTYNCPAENYDNPENPDRSEPCGWCEACYADCPNFDKSADPEKTVDTIEFVSETLEKFLVSKMKDVLGL